MADTTAISWCDSTWSPWEGCTQVSPACDHCYAKRMNDWLRKGENWGPGAPRRLYSEDHWEKPLRWNAAAAKAGKPRTVFPSVCDPFDNEVDPALRVRFFALIAATPHLTWLLLTKRIGNVAKMLGDYRTVPLLPNIWLGATICNQEEADRDIPKLLAVPARVRFLSIEPMLGPVSFDGMFANPERINDGTNALEALDWVICGGESGPQARPMHPDWVRSLRDQCAAAGVPFHHKQNGEWVSVSEAAGAGPHFSFPDGATVRRVGTKAAGRRLDGRTHDEFPTP